MQDSTVQKMWAFGDFTHMVDEVSQLVLEGNKIATSSNYLLYEVELEPLPYKGLHNILLDGTEKAVAILETTEVEIIPFYEVSTKHAYLEGEGDLSLAY